MPMILVACFKQLKQRACLQAMSSSYGNTKVDKAKNVENNREIHQAHYWLVDPMGTKTSFLTSGSRLNDPQ